MGRERIFYQGDQQPAPTPTSLYYYIPPTTTITMLRYWLSFNALTAGTNGCMPRPDTTRITHVKPNLKRGGGRDSSLTTLSETWSNPTHGP